MQWFLLMSDNPTRESVRALVRDALQTAASDKAVAQVPSSRFIDVAPPPPAAAPAPEWDRDESAKTVITEDDVRGLAHGARLRIAENARLTPLAADLVQEQGIILLRRVHRSRSQKIHTKDDATYHGV